jgi:hypothetical protein
MRVSRLLFVLDSNLCRLGTIVRVGNLPEPRVIQGLLSRDTLRGVINEDLGKQIQEVLEEGVVRWDDVLHRLSVNSRNLVPTL